MSANDVAGAVAWPLLSVASAYIGIRYLKESDGASGLLLIVAGPTLFGAVYCIARLFGAHA